MLPIILASGSKNRKTILTALGLPFSVETSNFDEQSVTEKDYLKRAQKIAQGKAETVAQKKAGLIIAADTFTVYQNRIMEKPKDVETARQMLQELSGQEAISYTGFCFINTQTGFRFLNTAPTKITFRELRNEEIEIYLAKYPVTTWAAAYALIDEYLFTLAARLDGSLVGLTHGMPTEWLLPLLANEGYEVKL